MRAAEPSRTAYGVALRRAAHQLLDRPRVLDDPIALAVIRPEHADILRTEPARLESGRFAPYLRAFMAVRARFAEDHLAAARARGLRQYVVLGAGLDTSAYRLPAQPLRVWEVDHPSTQEWKRERLEAAGIAVPSHLTFVAVDFEAHGLAESLEAAGFDVTSGAVFSWLGVTPYLTRESIMATLGYVAGATAAGGGIAFDYSLTRAGMAPRQRLVYDRMAERVRALGEPWQDGFVPEELVADLRALGFAHVEDVTPEEMNSRYLAGRADGLQVGTLAHLMWAGAWS